MGENLAMLIVVISALLVAGAILELVSILGFDVPGLFAGVQ